MSRSQIHEVDPDAPVGNTVAERLARYAAMYVKIIEGVPVAASGPAWHEGHRMDSKLARFASAMFLDFGSKSAAAGLKREIAKRPSMTSDEQSAWLHKYMADYTLSDEVGSLFKESLLDSAAKRVATNILKAQNKPTDDVAVSAVVTRITTEAALADKYTPIVEGEVAAILAERHEKTTRKSASAVDGDAIAASVEL